MPSASSLPLPPSSSFISLDQEADVFSSSPTFFGAEDHLLADSVSNTGDGILTASAGQYWDSRSPPWFPGSRINPANNNFTSHPMNGGMSPLPGMVSFITTRQSVNREPNPNFNTWREPPSSNPENLLSPLQAHHPFQMATHHRATRSAISTTDPGDGFADDGSVPGDFMDAAMGMSLNPNTRSSIAHDRLSIFTSETDQFVQRPLAPDLSTPLPLEPRVKLQDRTAKNKPFVCTFPGCDRFEGFTSESDLDRHRLTRHNILSPRRPNKSWRCQACQTDGKGRNNTRVWLRLDNFRDHCRKSHKDQDINKLVSRSEITHPAASNVQQPSMAHSLPLTEQSLPRRVKMEAGSRLGYSDAVSQSSKGKAAARKSETGMVLPSDDYQEPPFPIVRPHNLSVSSQPTDATAMMLDDMSTPFLSSSSLFINTNVSPSVSRRETGLSTKSEEEEEHTFSDAILQNFVAHTLAELNKTLNLNETATEKAHVVLTNGVQQLCDRIFDSNEDAEGSSISSSSLTAETSLTPPQLVKKFLCKHPGCTRSCHRKSELNKHIKRHTRDWPCIWPGCTTKNSFGSKADWKRHESTLHWSRETFICLEETITGDKCIKEFCRGDQYKIHLRKEHNIMNEVHLRNRLEQDRRINPLPVKYLCGFCKEMIPTNSDTEEAWNKRFEHIVEHFRQGLGRQHWMDQGNPIISAYNHEGNSTKQGLNPRYSVYNQDDVSFDVGFDALSNGSSSGMSLHNNDTPRNQNNKNTRSGNRGPIGDDNQSPRTKRPRADEAEDDESSVASSSLSRNKSNRRQYNQ